VITMRLQCDCDADAQRLRDDFAISEMRLKSESASPNEWVA
jgi:hypothetical protein